MASQQNRAYQLVASYAEGDRGRSRARNGEQGFTLVELLVVTVLIPIIVGAVSLALLATFRVQSGITDRLSSTGDTQAVSATFFRDVQDASYITTFSAPTVRCGSNPPILSLEWLLPSQSAVIVSYSVTPNGVVISGSPEYQLVRSECDGVHPSTSYTSGTTVDTATSTSIISQNVPGPGSPLTLGTALKAVVTCDTAYTVCPNAASGWSSAAGVTQVSLSVNASLSSNPINNPANSYTYVLAAAPRSWLSGTGNDAGIAPLELINQSVLNGCSSGALVNVNGAMLFQPSGTVSSKADTINTAAVYYTIKKPSPITAFFGASASPPLPFTKLLDGFTDPFAGVNPPDSSTLLAQTTLGQPGVYSSNMNITTTVALAPGIYYFKSGSSLSIQGSKSGLTGSGVLLYFEGDASFTVGANSAVNISPMTTGRYAGLTIWQGGSGSISWQGNANDSYLNGVIYSPNGTVTIAGTDNVFASNIIANELDCSGGGAGSINIGYTQIPSTRVSLSFSPPLPATLSPGATYSSTVSGSPSHASPPIILSIDPDSTSNCSIQYNPVQIAAGAKNGTCIVDANQAGSGPYYAAIELRQTITVGP